MLLVMDARNRVITTGLRSGDEWLTIKKLSVSLERTADEYAMLLQSITSGYLKSDRKIESVWISCVVPAMTAKLKMAARTAFDSEVSVAGPGIKTGIKIRTENPVELGSELICAAVGAREILSGKNEKKGCIIVDFGAAITFTALNSSGEFMGVAITPGVETAFESLRQNTAQIPDVSPVSPSKAIGKTTIQAVQSGILMGYSGLISHLVKMQTRELGEETEVIGTGDDIGVEIMKACGFKHFHPELALEGLVEIAIRNLK